MPKPFQLNHSRWQKQLIISLCFQSSLIQISHYITFVPKIFEEVTHKICQHKLSRNETNGKIEELKILKWTIHPKGLKTQYFSKLKFPFKEICILAKDKT